MADDQEPTSNENRPSIHENQGNEEEQRSQRSIDESLLSSTDQRPDVTTRNLVVLCILFVELCERLTFYGVAANLVFYCRSVLNLPSPLPSTITLAFQGEIMCIFRNEDRLGTAEQILDWWGAIISRPLYLGLLLQNFYQILHNFTILTTGGQCLPRTF